MPNSRAIWPVPTTRPSTRCGRLPPAIGSLLKSLQMGLMPFYALAMVLGLVVMLAMGILWVVG